MSSLPSLISERGLETLCDEARRSPPGAIVEVGVYKGGSAARLYQVALAQGRELWLFDTFTGHPRTDESIDDHPLGRFADAIHPAVLREMLPSANVIVGTFPESMLWQQIPPIAFVHADADLYGVTRDICHELPPLMVPGGVLLFDDYSHGDCRGCRKAVDECFIHGTAYFGGSLRVETLPDGRQRVEMPK